MEFEQEIESYFADWRDGKRDGARDRAQGIVERSRDEFAAFEGLPLEVCVGLVSSYRANGRTREARMADIWCQATFGPQRIVGKMGE